MTKHTHSELIKAWADGAQIEYFCESNGKWLPAPNPSWDIVIQYRIADKFRELKEAHAKGARIEVLVPSYLWTITKFPLWDEDYEYRIYDKHREVKQAFSRGEKIEIRVDGNWLGTPCPSWQNSNEYRVKPKPITVRYKRYLGEYQGDTTGIGIWYQGTDYPPNDAFIRWIDSEIQEVEI